MASLTWTSTMCSSQEFSSFPLSIQPASGSGESVMQPPNERYSDAEKRTGMEFILAKNSHQPLEKEPGELEPGVERVRVRALDINGFSGSLCTVSVAEPCKVRAVKESIRKAIGVRVSEQVLIAGTLELQDTAELGEVLPPGATALTLVKLAVPAWIRCMRVGVACNRRGEERFYLKCCGDCRGRCGWYFGRGGCKMHDTCHFCHSDHHCGDDNRLRRLNKYLAKHPDERLKQFLRDAALEAVSSGI
uniref:Ubiquitin-like domain-containing protein n=1 Tax=Alexandrium catenella TaxID=2925 RepID=A0A7S1WNF4_ALECA